MKSIYVQLMAFRSDKFQQTLAHGVGRGIGVGEAEDVVRFGICPAEYLPDTCAEDVRLARAGSRHHEYRSFDGFYRLALGSIEPVEDFFKLSFVVVACGLFLHSLERGFGGWREWSQIFFIG